MRQFRNIPLAFICLSIWAASLQADVTIELKPDGSASAPIDIQQPGEATTITLAAPSGYRVYDSWFVSGDGMSDPGSNNKIARSHNYSFTIGPNGLGGPVVATYEGRLIPVGGGGGGPPPLKDFTAQVVKETYDFSLTAMPSTLAVGQAVTLTAQLQHAAGETVRFYIGQAASPFDTQVVNGGGVATVQHTATAPGRVRYRIETSNPDKYPVPSGGDGNPEGNLADNEADVTWAMISYVKIEGLNATGAAEAHVKIEPPLAYTGWQHKIDGATTDQVSTSGSAGTIKMKFGQSGLKMSYSGGSTLFASVLLDDGPTGSAETNAQITEYQNAHNTEILWYYFFADGIGLKPFPSSIYCRTHKADYDVPASGLVYCVLSNSIRISQLTSTINYSYLVQLGLQPLLVANGSLQPNGSTFGLARPDQGIYPPNTTSRVGGPTSTWWYGGDARAIVEWQVVIETASNTVTGIPMGPGTNDVDVSLP